jgi:hypothetical protein
MTAAGEWLPDSMRACPCGHRYGCPCGCESCPRCDPPAPSLVAGAIGRGMADSAGSYRAQLDQLWREVVAALPEDDDD